MSLMCTCLHMKWQKKHVDCFLIKWLLQNKSWESAFFLVAWLPGFSICLCYSAVNELKFLSHKFCHYYDVLASLNSTWFYANCFENVFFLNQNCIEEIPLIVKSAVGLILVSDCGPKGHYFPCLGVVEYVNLNFKKASIGTFCAFAYLS